MLCDECPYYSEALYNKDNMTSPWVVYKPFYKEIDMAKLTEAQKVQKIREKNIKTAKALYAKVDRKTGKRIHSFRTIAEQLGVVKSTVFTWVKQ